MGLVEQVFEAGVVGCGGAGFPTHVKLNTRAECLIVNGAECEPLLRTDRWLMEHQPDALVEAAGHIARHLGATRAVIALKETNKKQIDALQNAIDRAQTGVGLHLLPNFYPAGDEQMAVLEVTEKSVPAGGLPGDVGAVVCNVATVLAVGQALQGIPFTHRVLTVTGAVKTPVVLQVPVGTSLSQCVQLAGGATVADPCLMVGGPAMGRLSQAEDVVTKTTSGLVVLPQDSPLAASRRVDVRHTVNRARSACIQCSFCTQLCPRYLAGHPLEPHKIMRGLAFGGSVETMLDSDAAKQALICCECGICEDYACPMGLQPRQVNVLLKKAYGAAGVRYTKGDAVQKRPEREERKVPSYRLAARLGVQAWYHAEPQEFLEFEPERITLPLRQHIGSAALPLVRPGDGVQAGQKVAACPEKALGAHVHTGLAGRVVQANGDSITIEKT